MRLGLGETAEAELRKSGLGVPKDKKRVDDADRIEKLWAIVYLFDKAGRYQSSHWPTRWHILDYRKEWPVGANRARWLIGYPRAYEDLLREHATTNKVPYALQTSIVREESAFDPLLESYANAIGLTQMIAPTAERFAKGTGIKVSRETLRDPVDNVTIGSRFLGFLNDHWKGFTLFVPPSYNGGEGYVRRNLKKKGTLAADEFIEAIVDDQIRNYTKRVTGTFFTYSWLYEQKVPEMPNKIPAEIIPK
jgi:soluble lytic murein transglycosylase